VSEIKPNSTLKDIIVLQSPQSHESTRKHFVYNM